MTKETCTHEQPHHARNAALSGHLSVRNDTILYYGYDQLEDIIRHMFLPFL